MISSSICFTCLFYSYFLSMLLNWMEMWGGVIELFPCFPLLCHIPWMAWISEGGIIWMTHFRQVKREYWMSYNSKWTGISSIWCPELKLCLKVIREWWMDEDGKLPGNTGPRIPTSKSCELSDLAGLIDCAHRPGYWSPVSAATL